jgi:hypothetical protein
VELAVEQLLSELEMRLWLSEVWLAIRFETLLLRKRFLLKLGASGYLESKGTRTSNEEFRSWHALAESLRQHSPNGYPVLLLQKCDSGNRDLAGQ